MKYNIGIDIGTNSVGWAVTNEKNEVIKKNNKFLLGSRIFEPAENKEKRRGFRSTRRRFDRKNERIELLRTLMKEEIEKVDPYFVLKLKQSFLQEDDEMKTQKDGLDLFLKEVGFYNQYPTIYHLRKALITDNQKLDIRLVYMAISHILKYRGNFLYEGSDFDINSTPDEIIETFKNIIEYFNLQNEQIYLVNDNKLTDILKGNGKKREVNEKILSLFDVVPENKSTIVQFSNALVGYTFDTGKLFNKDNGIKIDFSKPIEDNIEKLEEVLDSDNIEVLYMMRSVYDYMLLQKIMNGKKNISDVFIQRYEDYKFDLKLLKDVYRRLLGQEDYNRMFKSKKEIANYYNYNGKNFRKNEPKRNGAKVDFKDVNNLYKTIKKDLEKYKYDDEVSSIFQKIDDKRFLIKLNNIENGAIPYQLHRYELIKILDNQSKYYDFLNKKDNDDISVKDKILSIITYKIPYYIGPLNNKSSFAWVEKNNDEKIYPWNFNKVIDDEKSAEKFIERMTSNCTYLPKEPVIPRNSLLYSKFCVLNEVANIRVNGKRLDDDIRKLIVDSLFVKKGNKKVNEKKLIEFLKENNYLFKIETIEGFNQKNGEKSFLNNRASYIDMIDIFGSKEFVDKNNDDIEEIIKAITLFTEKNILKKRIERIMPNIDNTKLNKLLKLKYTGWGSLSKKLLTGLRSIDDNKTIMDKLENSNLMQEGTSLPKKMNFMQIINEPAFGFNKQIEEFQKDHISNNISYKDIEEIQCSPVVKRSLWQSIKIVKEITKILKSEPENIFIEFTREEDLSKKGKNTDSRLENLKKIYEKIGEEGQKILEEIESKISENKAKISDMVYLYYLQNGKCLYSGKPLTLSELSNTCDIDHIIPQSYIKDDSFDNKALVIKKYNSEKSNNKTALEVVPVAEKNEVMYLWNYLRKNGLMTEKKYRNLNRREILREDEKEKFIARQLVETSQTIKYAANILKKIYSNTKVFSIRAKMTSDFRKKYDIIKSRNINNYHHAHDAYIVSIIGNHAIRYGLTSFEYGTKNEYEMKRKLNDYFKMNSEYISKSKNKDKELHGIILNMIGNESDVTIKDIKYIKDIIFFKKVLVTKKLEEQTGEFYNQTLYGKKGCNDSYISFKKGYDIKRYGGYKSSNKAYFTLISHKDKKNNKVIALVGITIQEQKLIETNQLTLLECIEKKGYKSVVILKNKILKFQRFTDEDGNLLELTSDKYFNSAKELIFKPDMLKTIAIMEKKEYLKYDDIQKEKFNSKLNDLFDIIIKKIRAEVKVYNSEADKLEGKREYIINLDVELKVELLTNILEVVKGTYKNLSKFELSTGFGMRNNFKINENIVFIDNSITGFYEKRYKVSDLIKRGIENGLENSCDN